MVFFNKNSQISQVFFALPKTAYFLRFYAKMQPVCLVIQNCGKRNLKPRAVFLPRDFGRAFVHKNRKGNIRFHFFNMLFPVLKKIQYTVYTAPRFASLEFPAVFLWKARLRGDILQDFSGLRRKF